MLNLLFHWFVSGLSLMITAYFVRGFVVKSFMTSLLASVVIGVANVLIWPILIILTLPLNILTLGLFTFVVNGMVLKLCAVLLPGFKIETWGAAVFGALILSIVSTLLHYYLL